MNLPPDQVTADLNAATDYVAKLPACNGKVVVCGFCWGGGQAFRFATNSHHIKAAFSLNCMENDSSPIWRSSISAGTITGRPIRQSIPKEWHPPRRHHGRNAWPFFSGPVSCRDSEV